MTTNVMLRDLDMVLPNAADGRRLEVVADGLPLFGGAQLAVDTTLVCALRRDGNPTRNAADEDGVCAETELASGRREPTLSSWGVVLGARLVVIAVEVGGRWSEEARSFLSQLAKARARGENKLLRKRAEQAWRLRWGSLLACTAARAVAMSLLELPGARGADGATPPSHEVERGLSLPWASVDVVVCSFVPYMFFAHSVILRKKKLFQQNDINRCIYTRFSDNLDLEQHGDDFLVWITIQFGSVGR